MFKLIPGPREGWLSLLLLLMVVLSPAVSLADAAWVEHLSVVPWLALFAVLLGTALAKLPVREWIAHLFATEIGLLLTAFYFASALPGNDWAERFWWLGYRVWIWLDAAFGGGISNDTMLFALLMALLTWLLGYISAWFAFRRHSVWIALVGSGSVLLVNLSYVPPNSLTYFLVFLLVSMLLLVRVTLYQKERDWSHVDAEYNRSITWSFLWRSTFLSIAIVAAAWIMPTGTVNASVAENWSNVTGPWQNLQAEFDRVFASVGASTAKAEGNRFSKTLALKGAIDLGADLVMQVSAPKPDYWATQAYDKYTGQGWMSSSSETTRLDSNDQRLASTSMYQGRLDLEQRFRVLVGRSTSLFAASSPVKLSLPVNADSFGNLEDLADVKSVTPLRSGQQYAVISSVSVAGAEELRPAGTDYPDWIQQRYLQLPQSPDRQPVENPDRQPAQNRQPPQNGSRQFQTTINGQRVSPSVFRIMTLTRRVTDGTKNPYDSAVAIESYLRRFKYDINVSTPPPDRDAVDWFLTTSRAGYCDYFASAMAVMARTIGIPSRVVTGYNTGTYNEQTGYYDVRQENAHTWPELFFPEYGWVRFEPTPSQPASSRPETSTVAAASTQPMDAGDLQALGLDTSSRDKLLLDDPYYPGAQSTSNGSLTWDNSLNWPPIFASLVVLFVAVLSAWRLLRWRMSRLSPSGWVYLQMCAVAALAGWKVRPSQTPLEYGRLLSHASPELRPDVDLVINCYVEETYRGKRPAEAGEAERSWTRLRTRLPLLLLRRRMARN
jgi:transglutaminase-like putative cysteine protease